MHRARRSSRLAALAVAGVMVLAACGTEESAQTDTADAAAAQAEGDADGNTDSGADTAADATTNGGDQANSDAKGGDTSDVPGVDLGGPEVDPASEVPTNLFPDLVVDDVTRSKKVNLRNLVPSEKPVLVWMWAPHWPVCRREAPDVEQFARDHPELEIVGLGTQDSLDEAHDFIADTGIESFTMLWDESFESWIEIGITSQPSAVLLAPNGDPITGWIGPYPEDEVLELIAPHV